MNIWIYLCQYTETNGSTVKSYNYIKMETFTNNTNNLIITIMNNNQIKESD